MKKNYNNNLGYMGLPSERKLWKTQSTSFAEKIAGWVGRVTYARAGTVDNNSRT